MLMRHKRTDFNVVKPDIVVLFQTLIQFQCVDELGDKFPYPVEHQWVTQSSLLPGPNAPVCRNSAEVLLCFLHVFAFKQKCVRWRQTTGKGKGNLAFSSFSEKRFSCLLLSIKINLLSKWILSKLIVLSPCSVSPRNGLKYCYVFACSWLIEILINYMNKPRKIKVGFCLNSCE